MKLEELFHRKSSLMLKAVRDNHIEYVEYYLKKDVNINLYDKKTGQTLLIIAAANGYLELTQRLLMHKADVNSRDWKGRTALFTAAANGYYGIVELLLNHGADKELKDIHKKTAYIISCEKGYSRVANLLSNRPIIYISTERTQQISNIVSPHSFFSQNSNSPIDSIVEMTKGIAYSP